MSISHLGNRGVTLGWDASSLPTPASVTYVLGRGTRVGPLLSDLGDVLLGSVGSNCGTISK